MRWCSVVLRDVVRWRHRILCLEHREPMRASRRALVEVLLYRRRPVRCYESSPVILDPDVDDKEAEMEEDRGGSWSLVCTFGWYVAIAGSLQSSTRS